VFTFQSKTLRLALVWLIAYSLDFQLYLLCRSIQCSWLTREALS